MAVNQEESSFRGITFGNTYVRGEFHNKNLKDLGNSWYLNYETGNSLIYADGKVEVVSEDIVDLLPKDPFGMDIGATITGLIEDFSLKNLGFESGEDEDENVDDQLLAKVNIVWNSANGFHADLSNLKSEMSFTESSMELNSGTCDGRFLLDGDFSLKNLGFESGEDEDENVDDQLLAKVNIVWNSANGFHADLSNLKSETSFTESSMELNNGTCDSRFLLDGDFSLKNLGFESGEDEDENVDDQLLAKVNIVWNSANSFHADLSNLKSEMSFTESSMELNNGTCDGSFLLDGELEDILGFNFDKYWTPPNTTNNRQGYTKSYVDSVREPPSSYVDSVRGPPSCALSYALRFLGLRDLLTVERVCKSLRDDVQTDPLLWRNVHVDYPLNRKITDDDLLFLVKRAQGTLQSLSLVDCPRITDRGLERVLESNPGLTKLNVAGCRSLSVEGIIGNLRFFKSVGRPGISYLRIGGILGVTSQHFEELKSLIGIQNQKQQQRVQKPRFYQAGQLYLSFDDEREIDIEICPRCQKVRQVYDCPADGCKGKLQTLQACRACTFCISRCMDCGCCLSNCDYEETFGLDLICLDCCKQIFNLQEGQTRMTILPNYVNQQASYRFFLYG